VKRAAGCKLPATGKDTIYIAVSFEPRAARKKSHWLLATGYRRNVTLTDAI
jgi:hypothetical protein